MGLNSRTMSHPLRSSSRSSWRRLRLEDGGLVHLLLLLKPEPVKAAPEPKKPQTPNPETLNPESLRASLACQA